MVIEPSSPPTPLSLINSHCVSLKYRPSSDNRANLTVEKFCNWVRLSSSDRAGYGVYNVFKANHIHYDRWELVMAISGVSWPGCWHFGGGYRCWGGHIPRYLVSLNLGVPLARGADNFSGSCDGSSSTRVRPSLGALLERRASLGRHISLTRPCRHVVPLTLLGGWTSLLSRAVLV